MKAWTRKAKTATHHTHADRYSRPACEALDRAARPASSAAGLVPELTETRGPRWMGLRACVEPLPPSARATRCSLSALSAPSLSSLARQRALTSRRSLPPGCVPPQPYIAMDEMLLQGPTSTRSPTRSLQSTIKYDMDSHYRFGGVAPQSHRDPRHAPLEKTLLEFITKEGTPGVMPSEPKLRVRLERHADCLCRGFSLVVWFRKVSPLFVSQSVLLFTPVRSTVAAGSGSG